MRIFVFGSNLGGRHGAGAAAYAMEHFGAVPGVGVGPQGQSYAIPTKACSLAVTLPLHIINRYVDQFIEYVSLLETYERVAARLGLEMMYEFQVTRIGCGYAGYRDEQIAPMFAHASRGMCRFDTAWQHWLGKRFSYWGTF